MINQKHLLIALLFPLYLSAQTDQVAVGASYINQTFYTIENGATTSIEHTDWDIAFTAAANAVGVFVNEGVATSMTEALPQVELYLTASSDFSNVDTAGMTRIYNNEINWAEGAFNHVKNENDPFDMGWGDYDVSNHHVNGSRVFAIKLRNGDYKKLFIQSLIDGVYTIQYADLDGSNETSKSIVKAEFEGKTLAYFSFESEEALDLEPDNWDLLFTRYSTPLDDGNGGTLDYIVTGILTNAGVEVAQADEIDPIDVDYLDFENDYTDSIQAIGHDWKYFDLSEFQWVLPLDRVYFVKTEDGKIWKIYFFDFEGSSSGITTLEKSLEAETTAFNDVFKNVESFDIFPNPANDFITINFETTSAGSDAVIQITNNLGQVVHFQKLQIQNGFNTQTIPFNLSNGIYNLSIRVEQDLITKSFVINNYR